MSESNRSIGRLVASSWRHRELLRALTVRELKARYRGSALGFLWSLVNPLLLLSVYTLVFSTFLSPRFGDGASNKDPYALFLISGLFPWIWCSTSLLEGTVSLLGNAGLIRKAVFPFQLLPLVSVGSNLVHFLLALPILLLALAAGSFWYPILDWGSLAALLVVALQLLGLCGATLGLSALCVHFKDIRDLLANVLQLAFFLAPILYESNDIPVRALQIVIRLNPFTPFASAYQATLFRGEVPALGLWLEMSVVAGVSLLIGGWLFLRLEETLVEAV